MPSPAQGTDDGCPADAARASISATTVRFTSATTDSAISESSGRLDAARTLAESAIAGLAADPVGAEAALRLALVVGAEGLSPERRARVQSLIVTAISQQPGRAADLAAAALVAADGWNGLSAADAAHHTVLAARVYFRAGSYGRAGELYARALAYRGLPYPLPEIALLYEQYGECLSRLSRYRAAAREFAEGAALVAADPACRELHTDLLAAAEVARNDAERS